MSALAGKNKSSILSKPIPMQMKPLATSGMVMTKPVEKGTNVRTVKSIGTVGEVSNSLGPEVLVGEALAQSLNAINKQAYSDKYTWEYLDKVGTRNYEESTIVRKLKDSSGWNNYIRKIMGINDLLERAKKMMTKGELEVIEKPPLNTIQEGVQKQKEQGIVEEPKETGREEQPQDDVHIIKNENKQIDGGILFIKDLVGELAGSVTGYENYSTAQSASDGENLGLKGNPQIWSKWDDENIIALIEKGASITWHGPLGGPLQNMPITINGEVIKSYLPEKNIPKGAEKMVNNYLAMKEGIGNGKFSFHQVFIPDKINILEQIKLLAKALEDSIRKEEKIGINEIVQRVGEKNFFPINNNGLLVNTNILKANPINSMSEIGTGLINSRVTGAHESMYLGVDMMEFVLDKVLGSDNYIFLTGTVTEINIPSEISLPGKTEQFGGLSFTGDPTIYQKGDLLLVRGIYIDRLGEYNIAQISTSVQIGKSATHVATAKQLIKRKMLMDLYPLLGTLSEKEYLLATDKMKKISPIFDFRGKYGDIHSVKRIPGVDNEKETKNIEKKTTEMLEDKPRKEHAEEKEGQ